MSEIKHTPGLLAVHRGSHEWQIFSGEKPVAQVDFWKTPIADSEAIEAEQKANAERLAHCWNHHDKLVAALENIMAICGNIPDDRYQTRCGPNTSTDRGIKVVAMRRIARETLAQCKPRKGGREG